MRTTSEKLTYLNTTKEKIRDSINLTGANIGTSDTFRSYASKLKKGYIDIINNGIDTLYNNFPKVSGIGSNLSLTPTYEAPIKLNEIQGDTLQDGTPTPDSPVEIQSVTGLQNVTISNADNTDSNTYEVNLGNIELNKIGDYEDSIKKSTGKNLFDKDNANILNAIINGTTGDITAFNTCRTAYIQCKPNTTYSVSRIAGTRFIIGTTTNTPITGMVCNQYKGNNTTSVLTITTGTNDNYLLVFYYNSGSDTLTEETIRNSIMINEGTALPYEPYGKVWYLEKNIGKVVLIGASNENWAQNSSQTQTNTNYFSSNVIDNLLKSGEKNGVSNYFIVVNELWNTDIEGIQFSTSSSNIRLRINKTIASDLATFKTWLSNNNTIVYYILSTPTYTEITNTELIEDLETLYTAKSQEGTTNISITSEDLEMILNVSALKGDVE